MVNPTKLTINTNETILYAYAIVGSFQFFVFRIINTFKFVFVAFHIKVCQWCKILF